MEVKEEEREQELDPSAAAKRGGKPREGKLLFRDSEGVSPWLQAMFFNNVPKPVSPSPGTFTQSRQSRGPSLIFLLSGDGTSPASGQPLPPEAELPVRDKQEGPREAASPSISQTTAAVPGDALTAEAGMSANSFVTVEAGSPRLSPATACSPCTGPTFQAATGAALRVRRHNVVHL